MKNSALFLILLFFSSFAKAQDLQRIKRNNSFIFNDYFVLKNNKDIKQGQFLKYYDLLGIENNRILLEYGKYYQNQKNGIWMYFDPLGPINQVISLGEYREDKKNGKWTFFYRPEKKNSGGLVLGFDKVTYIVDPEKGENEFRITTDIEGLRIASTGAYVNGKKTGEWDYYTKEGTLVNKFDFSSNRMIYCKYQDSVAVHDSLGGIERLRQLLDKELFEKIQNSTIYRPAIVTFDIKTENGNIVFSNYKSIGGTVFSKIVRKSAEAMSSDWVSYDPYLEGIIIQVQVGYTITDDKGYYSIDYIKPQTADSETR